jgi:N-acetylglucosaminyldiphosphoundecaprenol N-acetyl-beta-D-mannosaminyltransferase
MSKIKFVKVMGLNVFSDSLEKINETEKCQVISTINPFSHVRSKNDQTYKNAIRSAEYLTMDGVYFNFASILLNFKIIKKNQGPDIYDFYIKKANKFHKKIFLLGSSNEVLIKMKDRLKLEFPNIECDYYSPPYKEQFNDLDLDLMVEKINIFEPHYLFIGISAPKQEKIAYLIKDRINAKLTIQVGAVFDWYAGTTKKISKIWWKLRLGWLIRTIHRPSLLKLYPTILIFIIDVFRARLGNRNLLNGNF